MPKWKIVLLNLVQKKEILEYCKEHPKDTQQQNADVLPQNGTYLSIVQQLGLCWPKKSHGNMRWYGAITEKTVYRQNSLFSMVVI